jgi:hypothetical protein
MRVKNNTSGGVFVPDHGVVQPGEEATVRDSDGVQELLENGALSEVKGSASSKDKDKEAS